MTPLPDTSRVGTRAVRGLPTTPRPDVLVRRFFPQVTATGKIRAPKGYGFDGRGDLRKLSRIHQAGA